MSQKDPTKNEPAGAANRLIHETSPYLRQHARNPVDWYPWGDEALERARKEGRMIFLSIGYSSCHWCHVVERESFEDPDIAKMLNENFVNIKVDREERPDVDAVYMEALQLMTGRGGWPLNVWLTPDQVPVFAGTYFPPQDYHGQPGFPTVIHKLAELYRQDPEKVKKQAAEMREALNNDLYDHISAEKITEKHLDQAISGFANAYDSESGGFSGAPKFPTAMGIGFLLRYGHNPGSGLAHKMALTSLEKMIYGGIYDQVGGGFHRYSTDREWLVPHFEKMLYDNALLLPVLAEAALISDRSVFSETVEETIAFLNREMQHPDGGYYAALDADTDGEEGKFYTFTDDELRGILDDDSFSLICERFGVSPAGNWEGATILNRTASLQELAEKHRTDSNDVASRLNQAKKQILAYRNQRTRPGLDDKIITSWNALMLIAHCRCARLLNRDPGDAIRLGEFLAAKAFQDDTVYRIIHHDGSVKQPGFLDDYALLADGFSHLFELTGNTRWLSLASDITRRMLGLFYDSGKSAFHFTARNQAALISQTRDVFDNAQPGGTSAAIMALLRIGQLSGVPEWSRTAEDAMEPLAETATTHSVSFGYLLQAMHLKTYPGREIVIISGPARPGTTSETAAIFTPDETARKMIAIWRENYDPASYLVCLPDGEQHKAEETGDDPLSRTGFASLYGDKILRDGSTTAYICRNFSCRKPVESPEAFREELSASG